MLVCTISYKMFYICVWQLLPDGLYIEFKSLVCTNLYYLDCNENILFHSVSWDRPVLDIVDQVSCWTENGGSYLGLKWVLGGFVSLRMVLKPNMLYFWLNG